MLKLEFFMIERIFSVIGTEIVISAIFGVGLTYMFIKKSTCNQKQRGGKILN